MNGDNYDQLYDEQQGATCYLNTMVQSLYMNHSFRDAVFKFNEKAVSER
jgi:hypothetical protein